MTSTRAKFFATRVKGTNDRKKWASRIYDTQDKLCHMVSMMHLHEAECYVSCISIHRGELNDRFRYLDSLRPNFGHESTTGLKPSDW